MHDNSKIKRILCIVSAMNTGGAETFLMKMYRSMDRTKYQLDFYCMSLEEGYYESEIIALGGKVYHSLPKSKKPITSFLSLIRTIRKENYQHVMRISEHSLATLDLVAARLGGAKILIQRSSNANSNGNFNKTLHKIFRWLPIIIPNIKIAPSTEAAQYTFGRKSVNKGEVTYLNNGISIEEFLYDSQKRKKIRSEIKLNGKFVVGHVGRFSEQKNHNFLIDIFSEIEKEYSNTVLILVGKGELEAQIKEKIRRLGLSHKVIFTGVRSDIPELMMAMDVFVFPSYYEGMPNTIVEAQATGLPCIISDKITKEANITGLVSYVSLANNPREWANKALLYNKQYKRENMRSLLINKGYHINTVTENFLEIITKK